jgi:hypothetical protein
VASATSAVACKRMLSSSASAPGAAAQVEGHVNNGPVQSEKIPGTQ